MTAVPDLPVVDGGGVLHIQIHSMSAETLFELSQSSCLLAAVRLQEQVKTANIILRSAESAKDAVGYYI